MFFEFSRQFFDYAAIFLLHGDIAEGRDAFGDGAPRERVLGIGIPLDMPSLFSDVRDSRMPRVAKARPDGLDAVLLADLGRPKDVEVAVVPLVVRTRTVAILVADCGAASLDRESLTECAAFAALVGAAFERIIVRRKLEGFVPGDPEAAVGRVTAGLIASKRAASIAPKGATRPPLPDMASRAPALAAALAPSPAAAPSRAPTLVTSLPSAHTVDTVRPPSRRPESFSSLPPPPANAVAVRRLTGPPIPREEPSGAPAVGRVVTRRPPGRVTRAAPGGVAPPADEVRVTSDTDTAQALFAELGWVTEDASSEKARATTPDAIFVPPHRPPSPGPPMPAALPSVIVDVDVDGEVRALIDRVIAVGAAPSGAQEDPVDPDILEDADLAAADLLRLGSSAVPGIMARFPGPIAYSRARIATMGNPPRASECGPLLRVLVRLRGAAVASLGEALRHRDPDVRAWAAYTLSEMAQVEAVGPLVACLGDEDPSVAACAILALRATARAMPEPVREALVALTRAASPGDRAVAVRALALMRDSAVVPHIVRALGDDDESVIAAAQQSLVEVTRQDFGGDARLWLRWWEGNATRHRIEWLIDALTHDVAAMRRAAGDELRAVTREYFGYAADLPQRDRERAQQRYRDWWMVEGKGRFRAG